MTDMSGSTGGTPETSFTIITVPLHCETGLSRQILHVTCEQSKFVNCVGYVAVHAYA
jgi:hypothetical protein